MFRFCCNCMFFDFYISRLFPSTLCSICSADPCVNPHAYDYGCSGHLTKEEFEQQFPFVPDLADIPNIDDDDLPF